MNHLPKSLCGLLLSLSFLSPTWARENPKMKEWTFLVYLNGKNSLDSFGKMNIKQMETIGSTDDLNIVVQWGSLKQKSVPRLYITKSKDQNNVTSPVVMNLGATDMGDYKNLIEFVRWAKEKYPAKHYFINVWNHGGGWHRPDNITPSDISWDDESGNKITTEQLGLAMQESAKILGQKVDIYASDACLMGMVEVAAEMQDSVSIYGGSQELEPGEGWPYPTFLQKWTKSPKASAAEVAVLLSKEYLAAYSGGIYGSSQVTFSVFDLAKLPNFMSEVAIVGQELKTSLAAPDNTVKDSINKAAAFYYTDYKDFADMIAKLDGTKSRLPKSMQDRVMTAHNELVLSNDSNIPGTHGLSIWAPTSSQNQTYLDRYPKLVFNQKTNWFSFLTDLMK